MFAWLSALMTALPCFYLSFVLIAAWLDPLAWDDGRWVRLGVGLLALEFVLLHSGAFLAAMTAPGTEPRKQRQVLAGLLVFYTLLAWAFAHAFDSAALLGIFATITLGRLLVLRTDGDAGRNAMMARSAFGIALYIAIAFATVAIDLPAMGVTREVLDAVYPGRGGGLWERHPERAMVGAAVYFALTGLAELWRLRGGRGTAASASSGG